MNPVRESPTTVIRRCLVLLRRLQRGPATKEELLGAVLAGVDAEAYGNAEGAALDKRFEADKKKLREVFGVKIRYQRSDRTYVMVDAWEPLLDLPDEGLSALAFLQETFEPGTPNSAAVQSFLSLLVSYLSPERRGDLERQRTALNVEWGQRDDDTIAPEVERGLRKALIKRRLLAFDYYSPAQQDGLPRHHVVEPWERYFDSSRGHYYLYGYCRRTEGPHGPYKPRRYIRYRLGRIQNLRVLPDKLPPQRPRVTMQPLIYRLAPEVARRGDVTRLPGIKMLRREPQEDGSVVVHAETDDLWWAVRRLLHYGATCEVLGEREALYTMRRVVKKMAQIYGLGPDSE